MKIRLSHAALAVALIACPAFADDAPVKPSVALEYKIYIGGVEALAATVTIGEDAARYDVEIKAVTAGAIGRMMPWTINIGSKGNVSGDVLQPVEHAQHNNFQGKERSVVLRYDGRGGFIERKVLPDAQEDQRDEVPADQTSNTLDIVSGVFASLRAVDRTGSCNSRVPVFDGRRRFDLVYSDDGHETMEASGVAVYAGEALKCAVKVEPGAGYWKKNQKKFFTRKVNGEDQVVPIEVYIARVGAAKVEVPVRIESTSPFGSLVLNLQAVHDPS